MITSGRTLGVAALRAPLASQPARSERPSELCLIVSPFHYYDYLTAERSHD
jgi:hypothetical protein